LPINVDVAAIVVMESLGVISFLVALLFFRQRQRVRDKQKAFIDALNMKLISERGDGKCYSSEWVLDNIVYKKKKLWIATPLFMAVLTAAMAVLLLEILPRLMANFISLGYSMVIALFGIAALLMTDAFQAYSYARAIADVAVKYMDKEDQSYLELARESLGKAFVRFFSLGVAFAILGPFIPVIFGGAVDAFLMYTTVFFQASEASFEISGLLGIVVIFALPVLMLFLPEILGRILIMKGKLLTLKILKRRVKK